ncbi:hypothetical protein CHUAL_006081 [Chamberlinius hualienensis]
MWQTLDNPPQNQSTDHQTSVVSSSSRPQSVQLVKPVGDDNSNKVVNSNIIQQSSFALPQQPNINDGSSNNNAQPSNNFTSTSVDAERTNTTTTTGQMSMFGAVPSSNQTGNNNQVAPHEATNGNIPSRTSGTVSRSGSTRSRKRNEEERVHVEFFISEKTVSDRLSVVCFNSNFSLLVLSFTLTLKMATCFLYVARLVLEGPNHKQEPCENYIITVLNISQQKFREEGDVDWESIIWIKHPIHVWIPQVVIAIYSLLQTLFTLYLRYKGTIWKLLTFNFALELVNTVPFIVTLIYMPWKDIFIPVFLNCWLARAALEDIFNHPYLHDSQTAFSKQVTLVMATLFCFVFTSACGFQHIQRGGQKQFSLLESIYFVIISLATVGFGDVVPDIWPSQLFVIVMVVVALIVIPKQFESLATTWLERQKMGGSFNGSHGCAGKDKHVVVCATSISEDMLMDFINEFYSHRHLQDFCVVIMAPTDLDPLCKQILHYPLWSQRLVYLKGSCLNDRDLQRAKMKDAEACFLLGVGNSTDKETADAHTVLRSWAVQDFASNVPQYVQIFRPENKVHVQFAEFATCEDEFKYALLANNCMLPGSSSFFTLLLHTSNGEEGQICEEDWLKLYGKCSGNEIYSIVLEDSIMFGEYEGQPFTFAAENAHKKFNATLIGVQSTDNEEDQIMLNPGKVYDLKKSDILYYISITREEDMTFLPCEHSTCAHVNEYKWGNPSIILVADTASGGIFNFLVPLRTHYHLKSELKPIVLVLKKPPTQAFLDCIAWFPLVYWLQGTVDNIDDLLKAGINFADSVVVLNKESEKNQESEENMSDCDTIVAVQAIFKYYPNIKITTELCQSNNMRFMQFEANNPYSIYLANVEKKEKARGSNISFMFRMQFAAGNVFSASMVDTLLYQAFVKDYVIAVVRLMLGIDQTPGSGYLTSIVINKEAPWSINYGTMFHHLCSSTGDVPVAIYRTHTGPDKENEVERKKKKNMSTQRNEKSEINNLIRSRMTNLDIKGEKFKYSEKCKKQISYVIINPDCSLPLEEGDVIYVIKAVPTTCSFR